MTLINFSTVEAKSYPRFFYLVISHDRYFLDKVVDKVVELDPGRGALTEYLGGYTDYLAAKRGDEAEVS